MVQPAPALSPQMALAPALSAPPEPAPAAVSLAQAAGSGAQLIPPDVSPATAPAPAPALVPALNPAPATFGAAPAVAEPIPARPGFFALLLPQSGPLAGIAEATHSGFVEAESRAGATQDVRVYDVSGGPASVVDAYNRAVADGAGLVIGPLLKEGVVSLNMPGSLRVPVLALNYLDAGITPAPGLYQFGLSPEDEARAAAEDAFSRGLHHALVLVPGNDRGNRVEAALDTRLRELGGSVVGSGHFSGQPENWSRPVTGLLHYRQIDDKKVLQQMRDKAGPGVDPQRRNDFDFIFLEARADQAQVLWPLFRYYHAERMPIYGTSAVNQGHGSFDLAGIRFCDAAWVLDPNGNWSAQRSEAMTGRSMELARFYALGADTFTLALRLSQNELHAQDSIAGETGTLRIGDDGSIHRSLSCGRLTEGPPASLDPAQAAAQVNVNP